MPLPWPRPHPDRVLKPGSTPRNPTIQRMRRSRMFGWERNPLRRRIDRVEGGLVAALIVVFLIATPLLTVVAGHCVYGPACARSTRQRQRGVRYRLLSSVVPRRKRIQAR